MEYFYYFGFVYLFNVLWDIYDTYTNKKTPLDTLDEVMPDEDNPEAILKVRKKVFSRNSFLFIMLDLSCFAWTIIGIAMAVESPLFIFNLLVSCVVYSIATAYAISYVLKNSSALIEGAMNDLKGTIKNIASELPDIKNIQIINYCVKLVIISYVLYSHFI